MTAPHENEIAMNPRDVEAVIQRVRLELYRDNVFGALEIVEAAHASYPEPAYAEQAAQIRSWLGHLQSRDAYVHAQEDQYHRLRWTGGLKLLEKRFRMLIGRKARKMIERRALDDQFRELEVEVRAVDARDVLDAGSGEGGTAMALGARHPALRVEGVEISPTNVRIARRLNRLANVGFRQGLAEEVHLHFKPESFDLVYSFAVLEHVRDVDETIASMTTVLRPRGRLALVVPMREFRSTQPLPDFKPLHGYADHCRVFTERELRARFGGRPDFRLVKIPGVTKPGELPEGLEPLEFGEFFVSFGRG